MGNWFEQNRLVLFGVLVVLSLAGAFFVYGRQPQPTPVVINTVEPTATAMPQVTPTEPPPTATSTPLPTLTPGPLRVYISGEVNAPDVYLLPAGSIIKEAIIAAGGATEQADLSVVNQALELKDQQHIHIPAQAELLPTPPVVEGGVDPVAVRSAPLIDPAVNAEPLQPQAGSSGPVNINTATTAELETLPGIGPAIAQRIIDHRQAEGNFLVPEDITAVKGIGPATFEKLKDCITVN